MDGYGVEKVDFVRVTGEKWIHGRFRPELSAGPKSAPDFTPKNVKPGVFILVQSTPRLNPNVLICTDNQLINAVVKVSDCGFRGVQNPSESTAVFGNLSYYLLIYSELCEGWLNRTVRLDCLQALRLDCLHAFRRGLYSQTLSQM